MFRSFVTNSMYTTHVDNDASNGNIRGVAASNHFPQRPRSKTAHPTHTTHPASDAVTHVTHTSSAVHHVQQISARDRVNSFNSRLLGDQILYTLKDYMHNFQAHFFPGDEYMQMYAVGCRGSDGDFCMREDEIPSSLKLIDMSRKTLDKFGMVEGVDYICQNRYGGSWLRKFTKVKVFTSMAFKKLLLLNGDPRFVNYYVFVDQVMESYHAYQLGYSKMEKQRADTLADRLQEKLLAKELEIVRLKRFSDLAFKKNKYPQTSECESGCSIDDYSITGSEEYVPRYAMHSPGEDMHSPGEDMHSSHLSDLNDLNLISPSSSTRMSM